MKSFLPPRSLCALVLLSFGAFFSTSCHDYDDPYYLSGGHGVHVSADYYYYGGQRYLYGRGPWYRDGYYRGPVRHYVYGGHRYAHGHGPWYKNRRYVAVHRGHAGHARSHRAVRPRNTIHVPRRHAYPTRPLRQASPSYRQARSSARASGGHSSRGPSSTGSRGRGSRRR